MSATLEAHIALRLSPRDAGLVAAPSVGKVVRTEGWEPVTYAAEPPPHEPIIGALGLRLDLEDSGMHPAERGPGPGLRGPRVAVFAEDGVNAPTQPEVHVQRLVAKDVDENAAANLNWKPGEEETFILGTWLAVARRRCCRRTLSLQGGIGDLAKELAVRPPLDVLHPDAAKKKCTHYDDLGQA